MDEVRALVKELMQLDDDHEVLFLHGGASSQFMQVPMNLLDEKDTAAFADTGVWSSKAIKEAKLFGKAEIVCTSKDDNYRFIPKNFAVPNDARYFHITTNNTIYGTQWKSIPHTSNTLVADMSSDIFSRRLNFNEFSLIYAGAQKNMGPAGLTVVVLREDALRDLPAGTPSSLDYRAHLAAPDGMLNTPPTYSIYLLGLTLDWVAEQGGVAALGERNATKARTLYSYIDGSGFYRNPVAPEWRSRMNIPFLFDQKVADTKLEAEFLVGAKAAGLANLEGHRSVGGMRASLYNAMPLAGVAALIDYMREFARSHG